MGGRSSGWSSESSLLSGFPSSSSDFESMLRFPAKPSEFESWGASLGSSKSDTSDNAQYDAFDGGPGKLSGISGDERISGACFQCKVSAAQSPILRYIPC